MTAKATTFLEDCLAGIAKAEDVDNYIDAWHENSSSLTLAQYLGMTEEEYGRLVREGSAFSIIEAHRGSTEHHASK